MDGHGLSEKVEKLARGFDQQEVGDSSKDLVNYWKSIEAECENNPEAIFNLYEMLKRVRNCAQMNGAAKRERLDARWFFEPLGEKYSRIGLPPFQPLSWSEQIAFLMLL